MHPALDSRRRTSREGEEHKGIKTERDREMETSIEKKRDRERDRERDRARNPTTQKVQATRSRYELTHCHDAGKKNTRIEAPSRHGCNHPCFFGRTIFELSTCEDALSALASCAFPSHNTIQAVWRGCDQRSLGFKVLDCSSEGSRLYRLLLLGFLV